MVYCSFIWIGLRTVAKAAVSGFLLGIMIKPEVALLTVIPSGRA
jgi:hypothetical protein